MILNKIFRCYTKYKNCDNFYSATPLAINGWSDEFLAGLQSIPFNYYDTRGQRKQAAIIMEADKEITNTLGAGVLGTRFPLSSQLP